MTKIIELFFLINRINLYKWIELEDIKEEISKTDENFPALVYKYLSKAFGFGGMWNRLRWQHTAKALLLVNNIAAPKNKELPLLNSKPDLKSKEVKAGWEYKKRTIHQWSHMLASQYGWSLEYIKNLSIDTALALIQEILAQDQLDKEFQWGLSEISYSYDVRTKKSKFNPLPRPDWMLPDADDIVIPTIKIRASHVPVGLVITADEILKSQTPQS